MTDSVIQISDKLPRYTTSDAGTHVWCITPEKYGAIHRFFDTSPVSPSGRYVGLTRLPSESKLPEPGEEAEVIVVDLREGEERIAARTRGWDTQLGAQVQWGVDDSELYFNDLDTDTWTPFGVKLNPASGTSNRLGGPAYMISPDGRYAASPSLEKMGLTQAGYGVIIPGSMITGNDGAPSDDGIFVTDTRTGKKELLVSLEEIVSSCESRLSTDEYAAGDFYGFHVKWSPDGNNLLVVLRWKPRADAGGKMKHNLITLSAEGRNIRIAVGEEDWGRGGHHPNWCPDGNSVMMNLKVDGTLRFVKVPRGGGNIEIMVEDIVGSGHPTLHPNGKHILTDTYLYEPMADESGTVPIRWIDIEKGTERDIVRIPARPQFPGGNNELRIDPHPAWDRSFSRIVFNGAENGRRKVYLADLSEFV